MSDLGAALIAAGVTWPVLDADVALAGGGTGPAVVALDEWTPGLAAALSERAWRTGRLLLPVRCDGGTTLVGPLLHPRAPACLDCAEVERLATIAGRTLRAEPGLRLGGQPAPTTLPLLAELIAAALSDPAGSDGRVWAVRGADGTVSAHRVRPRRGGCARCGPLPDDDPEAARFVPAPRPLPDPYRLRGGDGPSRAALRRSLHDWRFGPVAHVSRSERLPLAIASAEVVADWVEKDGGYGRAETFAEAERVALFEAVERLAGMSPRGKHTVLRASYAELGPDRALDPAALGQYEPEHLGAPDFGLTPYTPDVPTTWVWGWSTARQRPLAVPEQVAYWGHPPQPRADGMAEFVFESSNGCGLGGSLEEAVLYGLFEVAERDAFLLAWYARTPLTRVALPDGDPMVAHLADRLDALGYELLLLDATNDMGIPAVVSVALCRDPGSPAPQAFFSAGAHLDPGQAIRSAVVEIVVNLEQSVNVARAKPWYFDRDRLRRMLADPTLVRGIDDHIGLHTLPEARSRYEFLLSGAADPRPAAELWPGLPRPVADLGALVTELSAGVVAAGMDVVVLDQSDPEVRDRLGLHAARVVVPGAVPLTFAHVYRRTRGLPRLLDVPFRLGRAPAPLRYDDLPLHPHPFP